MTRFSLWSGRFCDPLRAVQIRCDAADGPVYGSGYRITSNLILTAAHVVPGPDALVWFDGVPAERANVQRLSTGQTDLAILALVDSTAWSPVPPVTIGRLARDSAAAEAEVRFVGYPLSNAIGDARTKDDRTATIRPASYLESGLLAMDVHGASAGRSNGQTNWAGVSGAAVFAEGLLVAVVTADQVANVPGRLLACPVEDALKDPVLRDLLGVTTTTALPAANRPTGSGAPFEVALIQAEEIPGHQLAHVKQRLEARNGAVRTDKRQLAAQDLLSWSRTASSNPGTTLSILVLGRASGVSGIMAGVREIQRLAQLYPTIRIAVGTTDGASALDIGIPVFDLDGEFDACAAWCADQLPSPAAGIAPQTSVKPHIVEPYPLSGRFVGRQSWREALSRWLESDWRPLKVIVAIGGMGKSALAWVWLMSDVLRIFPADSTASTANTERSAVDSSRLEGVYWFSFYRRDASARLFIKELLSYAEPNGDWDAVEQGALHSHVLRVLETRRILIVMDGLERELQSYVRLDSPTLSDQHADAADRRGRTAADPHMVRFLRALSSPTLAAKVLITTRLAPADLEDQAGETVSTCSVDILDAFEPADVIELFRSMGIAGSEADIVAACGAYGYHPLTVRLLAGLITEDLRNPLDISASLRKHPVPRSRDRRVHILDDSFLALTDAERQLITRMSACRTAVSYNLAHHLSGLDNDDLDGSLSVLMSRGLLMFERMSGTFDMHPIVRSYSYGQLLNRAEIHEQIARQLADQIEHSSADIAVGMAIARFEAVKVDLLELVYQFISAGERESAAELWLETLLPALMGSGDYRSVLAGCESLCRAFETVEEDLDDEGEFLTREMLMLGWAEAAFQVGMPRRAVEILDRFPPPVLDGLDFDEDVLAVQAWSGLARRLFQGRADALQGRLQAGERVAREVLDEVIARYSEPIALELSAEGDEPDGEDEDFEAVADGLVHMFLLLELDTRMVISSISQLSGRLEASQEQRSAIISVQQRLMNQYGDSADETWSRLRALAQAEVDIGNKLRLLRPIKSGEPIDEVAAVVIAELLAWCHDFTTFHNEILTVVPKINRLALSMVSVQIATAARKAGLQLPAEFTTGVNGFLEQALVDARTSGSMIAEVMVLASIANLRVEEQRFADAKAMCREALVLCQREGLGTFEINLLVMLATAALRGGERDEAMDLFHAARTRADSYEDNGSEQFAVIETFRKEADLIIE